MRFYILSAFMAMALLMSCGVKQASQTQARIEGGLEHYVYKDSTNRVDIMVDITVPLASDSATSLIRDSLLCVLEREFYYDWENNRTMPTYNGDDKSLKAIIDYYAGNKLKELNDEAENDFKDRIEYITNDTTITSEERQRRIDETPRWEYESKITKDYETTKYVVYTHNTYQYQGGAHGGIGGNGCLTFDVNGKKIEKFFIDGAAKQMQKLLVDGLIDYFSDNTERKITHEELMGYLQVENGYIPLPCREPYLSADGLVLIYQQYEIAAYAAGMPTVTIPYKEAMPYLTEEVRNLLKK